VRVDVRNNNVEGAIRILKKKLQKEGFYTTLRSKEFYRSRSEKRRLEKAAGRKRYQKAMKKRMDELGY
jgi:small subunit ribosomal protein S21